MIPIKTPDQIEKMAAAGKIAKGALDATIAAVKPGITTFELDQIADSYICDAGATPGFKTVDDYEFATCININDGLVHGLPNDYVLKPGDLVSIDLGAYLDGWHSDLSHTIEVATNKHDDFLNLGKKALENGINAFTVGNRLGDVGYAMQTTIEKMGYTVSKELVGHGIGTKLHEDPYVPGYGTPGKGHEIKEGMVFAIEIIYQKGSSDLEIADDDWTIVTSDGSLAGLFEHTVAATINGPRILTI